MHPKFVRISLAILACVMLFGLCILLLIQKPVPRSITYGMSFSSEYTVELGLDPLTVLDAFIIDLGVRHFRLAAYWPLIEPDKNVHDFTLMDAEMKVIEGAHGTVILAVGRRLPRWPECHVPVWAKGLPWDEQKQELRTYITEVVNRYKDSPALIYWQVENEPYLSLFAPQYCGALDETFLKEEVALVKALDPKHQVIVTDSGNLGTWSSAYALGDVFGTSMYVYFWNPDIGKFKTVLPPWFYRAKEGLTMLLHGKKPTMLIELSLEPWLIGPISETPLNVQFDRMNPQIFDEIVNYARDTRYSEQYLWGAEWWYWLKMKQNDPTMWEKGKSLFK